MGTARVEALGERGGGRGVFMSHSVKPNDLMHGKVWVHRGPNPMTGDSEFLVGEMPGGGMGSCMGQWPASSATR